MSRRQAAHLVDTQGITMHYDDGWHFTDRSGQPVHIATAHPGM
ncbi:hypothetical protein [Promicromonospora iranensis]|uniref:Uncharacterized protein n=1 Tax=Promicromonospora iranensis TaxID=1105144 RepID=A0ABU2CHD9_9MICO|nr:hypothetical protein [Promicromonospora iranensis]MDR7380750.1 hypothetical protein [Promicromonospora iranensis]